MPEKEYRPRLTVEITEEQARKLRDYVPWGIRKALFQALLDDILANIEQHGEVFLSAILARVIKLGKKAKYEAKDGDS